ncbi:MAG: hypothetical protein D6814_08550 [Calditrichaeota bacterium]|nr:MAG: hypothetical protein D6814_08550 [Calditrichota bacterium]
MKKFYNIALSVGLVFMGILSMAINARAQLPLVLSKSSDFSTDDRAFSRSDTLFIKVTRPDIDFTNLKEMDFRLKPNSGGNDVEGSFTNNFDGTYTTEVFLGSLDASETDWELEVEIEDDAGNRFKAKENITITNDGSAPPQNEDNHKVEVRGHISEIQGNQILVRGLWITVDDQTEIIGRSNQMMSFADLSAGKLVQVSAVREADGSLRAVRVKIEEENENELEVKGVITAIGPDSLVVEGTIFFVDDNTEILDKNKQPVSLSDLMVGQFVEVKAQLLQDGKLWARRIKVDDENQMEDEFELTGPIESLNDSTIVVAGVTFFIDDQTQVFNDDEFPIGLSALQVGTLVEIKGVIRDDGLLWATRIKIEDNSNAEVETKGTIDSISETEIVVNGLAFKIDSTTVILDRSHSAADFSILQVGLFVEVKAFRQPNGDLLAVRIKLDDDFRDKVELKGAIQALTENSIQVFNTLFMVDSTTLIWTTKRIRSLFPTSL